VVFGTLHAFAPNGGGEVVVSSIVLYPTGTNPTTAEFAKALRGSDAVETLYDFARTILRTVASTVNAKPKLKRIAPAAKFGRLVRAEEAADNESDEAPKKTKGKALET
jgi:hypothetical protein